MSTRHNTFRVLFVGSGFEPTICKYREGISFEEMKSVICDAWGPARFNYESAGGMALPVNSNQSFAQFLERMRNGEVESVVREDFSKEEFPVLRCLLQTSPATDEFGVVDPADRLKLHNRGGNRLSEGDNDTNNNEQQQQQPFLNQAQEHEFLVQKNNSSMLRPVKPRSGKNEGGGAQELMDQQQQQDQQQQYYDSAAGRPQPRHASATITRVKDDMGGAAAADGGSSSYPSQQQRAQQQQYQQQQQYPQDDASGPDDDLDSTQRGDEQQQQPARVSFARGYSSENTAHRPAQPATVAAAADQQTTNSGSKTSTSRSEDTVVLMIRTQIPPICAHIRVDQGGLIGNLRAHILDIARRSAKAELPPNFLLSFSRPDCEANIDVEDDSDFNFLKASIKRHGAEEVVLYADVKGGQATAVNIHDPVSPPNTRGGGAAGAGAFSSPLKPNPFAPTSRSPSRHDPMEDAARHLI